MTDRGEAGLKDIVFYWQGFDIAERLHEGIVGLGCYFLDEYATELEAIKTLRSKLVRHIDRLPDKPSDAVIEREMKRRRRGG